jgi:hypothetical protein
LNPNPQNGVAHCGSSSTCTQNPTKEQTQRIGKQIHLKYMLEDATLMFLEKLTCFQS